MGDSYLARWHTPPPPAFLKSRVNTSALTCRSLLTYPCKDLAGDYVRPEGCDFTSHRRDPSIDLEHGRHPHVKGMPVCWARESLSKPGAPYAVELTRLDFAAPGQAPDYHTVPVGTEFYDKSCPVSMQIFAMREGGSLPASSLEFRAVPGFLKSLGRSPLENRDAFDFLKTDVVRWTVCAQGVNPGAMLLTKSLPQQVPPALGKILQDRRVNVGGTWEPLHGAILKALLPYRPHPDRTTVRVERKAMDDDYTAPAGTDITPAVEEETQPEDTGPPAKPTVQAHYDTAQGLLDLVDQAEQQLTASEHVKGKQFLLKKLEMIRSLAEDIKGMGDKIDGELNSDDAEPATDDDAVPDDVDMSTDDDGVMKAVRPVYLKALKVKRFTLAEVQKATEKQAASDLTPEAAAAVMAELKSLKKKLNYLT